MLFHHFLFDFDGTLVNSSRLHEKAYRQTLAEHAPYALHCFDYGALRGLTTLDSFLRMGITDSVLARCVASKQERYRKAVSSGRLKPFPHTRTLLQTLIDQGRHNYLVTSASTSSVELALEALDLASFFSGIITASDSSVGKPAPDPYLACLKRFGVPRSEAIVIEDASIGVTSARAAGLRVIGVHNEAIADLVDFYFHDLAEMSSAVRDCGRQRRAA